MKAVGRLSHSALCLNAGAVKERIDDRGQHQQCHCRSERRHRRNNGSANKSRAEAHEQKNHRNGSAQITSRPTGDKLIQGLELRAARGGGVHRINGQKQSPDGQNRHKAPLKSL